MNVCTPVRIVLANGERQVLTARSRRARGEQRDVLRARIVLAAADGQSNAAIAAWLAVTVDTVRKWRSRVAAERLAGLQDRPRSGRPRTFPAVAAAEVKAMACALPAETGVPLARWSECVPPSGVTGVDLGPGVCRSGTRVGHRVRLCEKRPSTS
jgi:hypothetical protein